MTWPFDAILTKCSGKKHFILRTSHLYEIGFINEALFEIGEAVGFEFSGLHFGQRRWIAELGQERRQIVQFHLVPNE